MSSAPLDFSRKVRSALAKRGVVIYALTIIPKADDPMPFANGERGYKVSDNGTGRLLTYRQVLDLAEGKPL
jgi:hypothetical protein